jgi:predicted metal-binding protein
MNAIDTLEPIFVRHGCTDFKWIDPRHIVVSQWVRVKCTFACSDYGQTATCPPNTPSVADCRAFFGEYARGVLFRFAHRVERPEDRKPWMRQVVERLMLVERDVFLAGYPGVFLLAPDNCSLCADCSVELRNCRHLGSSRPAPEAFAVDVFSTVRRHGYPIEVLTDYDQVMNRYGILLVE